MGQIQEIQQEIRQEIQQEIQPAGTATLCWVKLEGAATVPVLMSHARFRTGDFVGVVGKVVDNPNSSLPGVSAGLEKIVEAEYSYKR